MPTPSAPQDLYAHYGVRLPELKVLTDIHERLIPRTHRIGAAILASDVCIDLAQRDDSNKEIWLDWSERYLRGSLEAKGTEKWGPRTDIAIRALLKVEDLMTWRQGILRVDGQLPYRETLENASPIITSAAFSRINTREKISPLTEWLPVLLAKRDAAISSDPPFISGRLALAREDANRIHSQLSDPRWDSGLVTNGQEIARPSARFQVTSTTRKPIAAHRFAGVSVLDLSVVQPLEVLAGCLVEAGIDVDRAAELELRPYDTRQLDETYERVLASIV